MSLSQPNNPVTTNPGVSNPIVGVGFATIPQVVNQNRTNQIKGINANNVTGSGIPKHVTHVGVAMANAQTGATNAVNITFQRDPTDPNYSGVNIYVKGYQGNQKLVQVASAVDSPASVVLNNTGDKVAFTVQAYGNGGNAPLSSAPTTSGTLPKSSLGGSGITTINYYSPSNPPATGTTPIITCGIIGPGWPAPMAVNGLTGLASGSVQVSNNAISAWRFDLLGQLTVTVIGFHVMTSQAGSHVNVGIYNASGSKLIDSGAISTASTGLKSTTITAVTLAPGSYYFAQSTDNTAVATSCLTLSVYDYNDMLNLGTTPCAVTAANSTSAGVMPASLGALTADSSSGLQPVFAIFKP